MVASRTVCFALLRCLKLYICSLSWSRVELVTDIEGVSSHPVRRIVLQAVA